MLAYSGGLDTSVILRWLQDYYGCEVIAYCADVGQAEETDGPRGRRRSAPGASKLILADLREEFARDFVFPMMRANAVYEGYYLLGTSIARPVIAKGQVEIARAEGADAVGHGATGKGNDQVRFELTFARLAPELKVVAPWRHPEWPFKGRADMIAYANQQENSGAGHRRKALLDGSQPGARQLRRRHPRRSLARALQRYVPPDGRARAGAR